MNTWTPKTTLIVAGVAVLGVWYLKTRGVEAVKKVGQAVNPTNHDNVFNKGAQGLWNSVTDGEGSIGTDVYDFVHDDSRWWN